MKYIVFLGDGMADTPIPELGGKTPLMVAKKEHIDSLAPKSELGLAKTVPDGMKPGSDTANLSVMGYDPAVSYSGRSPLEALSMGLTLADTDIAVRCNLVTLSDEEIYADKKMIDYSAGEISSEESKQLIEYIEEHLGTDRISFHPGISYRHCLIVHDANVGTDLTPPHDITGKPIKRHLPSGPLGELFSELMIKSYDLLKDHPINKKRIAEGKNPANSVWFWGEGTKPSIPDFTEKNGIKGAVISAVDLLKGIGKGAGMEVIEVAGATGNVHTDFAAKGRAAIDALSRVDYVYIHVEAPDESGHQGSIEDKITSIEKIDSDIVGPVLAYLQESGEHYHVLVCPDHPTPIATRTHSAEPVPYMIYKSDAEIESGITTYNEETAASTGIFVEKGYTLIDRLLSSESLLPREEGIDPDVIMAADGAEEIHLTSESSERQDAESAEDLPEQASDEETPAEPKKKGKFIAFFKRHLLFFIIAIALVLVAVGLTVGHFVATYHLSFIRSEEALREALEKDHITTLVFKSDVTVEGDLVLSRSVDFDMNEYTLTVNGDFTLPVEKTVSLGYKTKGEYTYGGEIVANAFKASGTGDLNILADLKVTSADISAASFYMNGSIYGADSVSLNSPRIIFYGDAGTTLYLSDISVLSLTGCVTEIRGGKEITLYDGSVDMILGVEGNRPTVYDEVGSVKEARNVGAYYRVTQLATPDEIYVLEENGDFKCYVSEVIGSDKVHYRLNGGDVVTEAVTPGTTVILIDSDNLIPGEQTISLYVSSEDKHYTDSNSKSVSFEFSAKLDTPIPSVVEEDGRVYLIVPYINHADKYAYSVHGEKGETTEIKTDITDKVAAGGVYIVKVTATSNNKYFSDSNEAMTSYVTYVELGAPTPTAVKGEKEVTFSWEAVENADRYLVNYGDTEIYTTATTLSLPYLENVSFHVTAKAKSGTYYLDSAKTTLTGEAISPADPE